MTKYSKAFYAGLMFPISRMGILLTALFLFTNHNSADSKDVIIYSSPIDNAELVNVMENIIFKTDKNSDLSIEQMTISVKGNDGRIISGKFFEVGDGRTFIFDPHEKYHTGENITAELIFISTGKVLHSLNFRTSEKIIDKKVRDRIIKDLRDEEFGTGVNPNRIIPESIGGYNNGGIIKPQVTITKNNNPSDGTIFFANIANDTVTSPFIMIMKNNGEMLFQRQMPETCYDFKVHINGLMTYFQNIAEKFYAMDSTYTVVDSFATGNGYLTDLHDILIKDDGNILLMSYDVQIIDMSLIVPGGSKNANVTGLIIQEIDQSDNVIFQWRSWDHFEITDADSVNLSLNNVDYCHGNAFDVDDDGHYVISSRNMSEITKINSETGAIIWRLGGKNNQFTFINDPIEFSYQHAIHKTEAGTFTLFDNGNFHSPKFSRSVEYRIDETAMTAEKVWEYRNVPSIYTFAMGYTERLENGNTTVSWGFANTAYTEVNSSNEVVFEFNFSPANFSYRIFRENWNVSPEFIPNIPDEFALTLNYPNPFNGRTNIYYNINTGSNVTIKVYDILGKELKTLINNEFRSPGKYVTPFDSGDLASGVYIYQLLTGGEIYTHKMVLTK
ncbi:MAG TPA: aryl-sulfate sulfotransferase [Ignavibacteria bacterium]|nr:hypothetical protein [Bacteroidota bacterium]HRI85469.1 aryl-sulfate sulfotransferase [Ignavibacteria bacterium]HRK00772.1 aryl-sulfate sulfotransferase [Ignavibacteria bacterium]